MTDRIYYTAPDTREFDALVASSLEHGGHPAVTLDRTAFYPTSGGQPFDTGRLGDVAVIETVDVDNTIVHVLAAAIPTGQPVHGAIDWPRRFDHMQQHTGQHVLSGAFDRLFDNATVGFHMGGELSTIDLAREASAADIARAEDEANRIVWENRPVSIRFVAAEEVAALALRKEPVREGPLRLIEIDGFDLSACGGTHVASTGAIGTIVVVAVERFKGGTRLTFACGGRALRSFRTLRDIVAGSVRVLSVAPSDLTGAIERLTGEGKDQRAAIKKLQASLATHEAARLLESAQPIGGVKVVTQVLEGWDGAGLKTIASEIAAADRAVAVLMTGTSPMLVVIARSPDVNIDAHAAVRSLIQKYGGKGGGKPDFAQGGGLTGDVRQIQWDAAGLVEGALAKG